MPLSPARRTVLLALAILPGLATLAGCSDDDPGRTARPTASNPGAGPSLTPSPEPEITVPSSTPSSLRSVPASPASPARTEPAPEDPLAPAPPLATAPPTGQPTCQASDLTITDADAVIIDSTVQELFVVRTSGPDCQLKGYPSVELQDAAGRPLAVDYRQGGFGLPAEAPQVHTLSRKTSVSFYVASGRFGDCVPAAQAVIRLPGTAEPLTAQTSFSVCDQTVGVSPVRRELGNE